MINRHEDWQPVEPGHVIPTGQPYAVEFRNGVIRWQESVNESYPTKTYGDPLIKQWFVDSSWKPPLVLPTEPTWGIAVTEYGGSTRLAEWDGNGESIWVPRERYGRPGLRDFIPLTDEQIARIKAASGV